MKFLILVQSLLLFELEIYIKKGVLKKSLKIHRKTPVPASPEAYLESSRTTMVELFSQDS